MGIYAVIKTGGKQYRVSPGDVVQVEKLPSGPGSTVEIGDVFLFVNGADVVVGNPIVANVRVIAEVVEEGRGEKILIFKKRRRKHYQKSMGHRQHYTALRISEIIQGDRSYRADSADKPGQGNRGKPVVAPVAAAPARKAVAAPPAPATVTSPPPVSPPPVPDTQPVAPPPRPIANEHNRTPIGANEMATPALPAGDREGDGSNGATPGPEATVADVDSMRGVPSRPFSPGPLPAPDDSSAAPNAGTPRRNLLYWSLAALLGLLLAIVGWLFKGDKAPPAGRAPVEATPAEQPPRRPPIKEIKVRKPERAPAPSMPSQPPD
mgnify:CR=1 FL=1